MPSPRKRFGQNFLKDETVLSQITEAIQAKPGDNIIEIGPGLGALTKRLVCDAPLTAIEIDRDCIQALKAKPYAHRLTLIEADVLNVDFGVLTTKPFRLVGNLPYNISTPVLFHVLAWKDQIIDMHFMLQKEVGERLIAAPGNKAYGRLSVMLQYACEIHLLFLVPPYAFYPEPKVDSVFLCLCPRKPNPWPEVCFELLEKTVKQGFSLRRKILRTIFPKCHAWEALGIDPMRRPETLSLAEWLRLAASSGVTASWV